MIDKYLEKRYGRPIHEIRDSADILREYLTNGEVNRVINVFDDKAWDDENISIFINMGYQVVPDALRDNILVCKTYMQKAIYNSFYNFGREAFDQENYNLLKDNIRSGVMGLPDCFKNDRRVLREFLDDEIDVSYFDKDAWDDELIDVYLVKMMDIYRKSGKPFKVPHGLYDNSKVFNYLLDKGLMSLDSFYKYSLELTESEVEKYIQFLKKNRTYINNQDNFLTSKVLLRRLLEEGLISYIYSFKDEAWDDDNILLFSKLLEVRELVIPKSLKCNCDVLKVCINMNKNTDFFDCDAWNDENIKLFISNYDGGDIPDTLYFSSLFLSYYLKRDDTCELSFFKDEAWSDENIDLFKNKLLSSSISFNEFPLVFMFDESILNFFLKNGLNEYLNLFFSKAWSDENVLMFEDLLKMGRVDFIPDSLGDSESLLRFCLENNLLKYVSYFSSKAWNVSNCQSYINSFDCDIAIYDNMKKSKNFAISLIMMGHSDELMDFPIKSTPSEYVDILFQNIIADESKYREVISRYNDISDTRIRFNFRNYVIRNRHELKNIDDIIYIIQNIFYSNSSEIKRLSNEISDLVLTLDNPKEEFKKIERLFLSDELPNVAKIYEVFRMFHSDSFGKLWINSFKNISPVLKRYSSLDLERHSVMCEVIIFADLLKAYVESNNMEFRRYLNNLKKGDELFRDYVHGGSISTSDEMILLSYLKKLTALYNQTLTGKRNNYVMSGDIRDDAYNLMNLFKGDSFDNLLDRIVKMYAYYIGISSYDELIFRIESKVKEADYRGRKYEHEDFLLEKGDFIKGINDIKFLPNILNNGSLASEFLGYGATEKGDATPLDTDVSMIGETTDIKHLFDKNYVALDYGKTWIVLKGDKFDVTRRSDDEEDRPNYDGNRLEAFYTGVLSPDHYGIRTGFASTNIDYIITREYSKEIGFEIARSGFYIPVLDTDGNILFTSEMYDNIRRQMNGLSYYGIDSYEFSDNLEFFGIEEVINQLDNKDILDTENVIRRKIDDVMRGYNLTGAYSLDGNLSRNVYNFVNIGSTGRGTNTLDADYDFMLLLDQSIINDDRKMREITSSIMDALGINDSNGLTFNNDIRFKNVRIGSKEVDIDITFEGKTDMISYSSDMALKDRISTMKKVSKEKALLVKANILMAKKILKEAKAYKPITSLLMEGGLGGAGVENWILANGGSFIDAASSFLKVYDEAYRLSESKEDASIFIIFSEMYNIWNFGENFYALRSLDNLHNEFVSSNMNGEGLRKMATALKDYFKKYDIKYDYSKKR